MLSSELVDHSPLGNHYNDVIMTTMAFQITSLTVVYSTAYSDADQRKHQSSASLAFVWGIHRDRWIPRTKGQLRGKCFHLMKSSCHQILYVMNRKKLKKTQTNQKPQHNTNNTKQNKTKYLWKLFILGLKVGLILNGVKFNNKAVNKKYI